MNNKKTTLIILAVLFVIALAATWLLKPDVTGNLTVSYIDAGQGDCQFIEFPNGKCMLIDASTKDMGDRIVDYISRKKYKKIDYVVATHPHADHIGGMQQVLETFEIGVVYMPEAVSDSITFENLLHCIEKEQIPLKKAKSGVAFSEDDVKIEFLSPISSDYDDLNNWSAVVRLTFGNNRFLFTGDAEKTVEKEMLEQNLSLKADVLKVAHHGSETSSSMKFLQEVNPEIAVIQCGEDNEYGHPHDEVLERLEDIGVKTYRTDTDGTVVITSDGEEVKVL